MKALGRGGVVLGDGGGGYLAEVEVHGEDEHGELGGGGAGPERGGVGLGGGCLLYTSPSPRD